MMVVDDGARDGTLEPVARLCEQDARVRSLRHPINRGYGAALKTGILAARGDLVFFTDADLQFDIEEIGRLLAYSDRFDVIAGYRLNRSDPWSRRLNAWAWGQLVDALFKVGVRDVDCAFKVFHRRVFDRIPIHSVGAFVNTESLVRARAAGFEVKQVPVSHFPRQSGQQSGAHPRVVARAFVELGRLYGDLREVRRGAPRWIQVKAGPESR